ncbi:alpha/beta hydrolase [Pedococcus sp. KACC 23699]|uniref:Alpha/beta hydrolase n=1 Tax=Pedococcus sp. KACC 23699 TaxID=3149228 RepID=A0AAU7JQE5_9MICO
MLLSHDVEGSGPPILLLHSGVADRRMWDDLVPALSHAFTVVRPDFRGFGDSPMSPGEYADADDLAALLDRLGIVDAAVVGSSFGGRVALELATLHPGRVSSLVLLCAAYRGVEPTADVQEFGAEEDRLLEAGDVEGATELNVRTFLGPDASEATRERLVGMQRRAFEVQLAADEQDPPPAPRRIEVDPTALAVPTVVVSGARDLDLFKEIAAVLAREIPGAESVELEWAGHLPSLERPDAVLALLLDVLRDDPTVHQP